MSVVDVSTKQLIEWQRTTASDLALHQLAKSVGIEHGPDGELVDDTIQIDTKILTAIGAELVRRDVADLACSE